MACSVRLCHGGAFLYTLRISLNNSNDRRWIRRRLLQWFSHARRDMPWRLTKDPYAIWVSEIMLQQTQAATVVPYFERFVAALPTIRKLAETAEEEVLRLWEGLGYYRRSRYLHAAAKILVRDHGGELPDDPEVVGALPGFGRYTVGAVLSLAFGRRLPILEANSIRVWCRLFAINGDPRSSETQNSLWQIAAKLLPRKQVGDFNQAVMELGATVCTPASPRCGSCPLAKKCAALAANRQHQLPIRSPRVKPAKIEEVAVVVRRRKQVFIVKRPQYGQWPGMWEFPHGESADNETPEETALRLLPAQTGITAKIQNEIATLRHGITRFRITLACLDAVYESGKFASQFYTAGRWVTLEQLQEYPLSSPQRKLAKLL